MTSNNPAAARMSALLTPTHGRQPCSCVGCNLARRALRLKLAEYLIEAVGFLLLADAGGWKLALAFFFVTFAAKVRARRKAL